MLTPPSGSTRVHFIVGDPIAQVKSPSAVSAALQQAGLDALVIPAHVPPADLQTWVAGVSLARNVDSIIVTVPHKFACHALCGRTSERAAFLGAVNTMRRDADGVWLGDMCDGTAFVAAMRAQGVEPRGKRALVVGAGGAGSAIAHALVTEGCALLAVHDPDDTRRLALAGRLDALGLCRIAEGSADPAGFNVVVNASPVGMQHDDPLPVDVSQLDDGAFVGCVITAPAITALVAAARARGLTTVTGAEMFVQVGERIATFLLEH